MCKLSRYLIFFIAFTPLFGYANETDLSSYEISVISERVPSRENTAWSISRLNANSLQNIAHEHIQQALNTTPGMNIQRGSGAEYLPALRSPVLTGAGACGNLLIMEQGIRLRSAGACNINELFDAHHEQASKIEILRGTSSAFHGANAVLGAIDVRLNAVDESALRVDWNDQGLKRFKLLSSYGGKKNIGSVYTTLVRDSGWRDDSGFDQQKISWRHLTEASEWTLKPGFTAVNLNQETAGFILGKDAFKDSNLAKANLNPEAYRDNTAGRAWLHAYRAVGEKIRLLISPYVRHADMAFLQHFLPGTPLEINRHTSLGLQASVYQNVTKNWQINYGADAEQSKAFLKQSQDAPTPGSAFLLATIPQGQHYNFDTDIRSLALFAQISVDLSDRLQLSSGIRTEYVGYDYDNHLPAGRTRDDGSECEFGGCRYNRPTSGKDRFQNFSPNLALSYTISNTNLFFSGGQNFRPPQANELYRLQREQNKADLDDVQTNYVNAGFEVSGASYNLRGEVYHHDQENLIIRDVNFFNVDNARATSTGLEVLWIHKIRDWKSSVILNWAKHQYGNNQFLGNDSDGNPVDVSGNWVDTAPRFFGQWQLEWQVDNALLTQISIKRTGAYYLEPLNEHRYDGHTLTHWNTIWKLNTQTTVRLKINNLFDKRHASRADYTGFSGYRYFPGEPRTISLGVDWRF